MKNISINTKGVAILCVIVAYDTTMPNLRKIFSDLITLKPQFFFQIKQRYINILLALANTFIVVCTLYCIRSIRKFKVVTNTTVHFEFLVLIEKKF